VSESLIRRGASPPPLSVHSDGGTLPGSTEFSDLYRRHHDDVRRWLRYLGATNGELDDVVQDSFLVVLRRLNDYDPTRSFRAWLFGITRRVLMDARRSRTRREARQQRAETVVSARSPVEHVEDIEIREFVEGFLATLDEGQRLAFGLCQINEMSAPEAAEALGVPVKTVRARLRLARDKFKRAARDQGMIAGEGEQLT